MGKVIVIEGVDSSGKETQTNLLYERIKGYTDRVIKISFPNYDSPACMPVKMYLAGEFGIKPKDVNPYAISTMYAIDRYASFKKEWEKYYDEGYIIITDRYVTSNMIHQSSKIDMKVERDKYLDWLEDLEYKKMNIPKEDTVIFLNMPIELSIKLLLLRNQKTDLENKNKNKDIHESDKKYLERSYEIACELSLKYNWKEIKCNRNDEIKSIQEINDEIFDVIKTYIF